MNYKDYSEKQWAEKLSAEEYRVLRQAGTERAGTGEYLHEEREGVYRCRACGSELFRSDTKFESGCGWPSFYKAEDAAVTMHKDNSIVGRPRIEVRCANCGSHLGHVFADAPQTPTGDRYCINSICLDFNNK